MVRWDTDCAGNQGKALTRISRIITNSEDGTGGNGENGDSESPISNVQFPNAESDRIMAGQNHKRQAAYCFMILSGHDSVCILHWQKFFYLLIRVIRAIRGQIVWLRPGCPEFTLSGCSGFCSGSVADL